MVATLLRMMKVTLPDRSRYRIKFGVVEAEDNMTLHFITEDG